MQNTYEGELKKVDAVFKKLDKILFEATSYNEEDNPTSHIVLDAVTKIRQTLGIAKDSHYQHRQLRKAREALKESRKQVKLLMGSKID